MNLDKIIPAMLNVQKEVVGMEKNSRVGKGKNAYDGTKASDVYEVFSKSLSANGLIVLCTELEETVKIERWMEDTWDYNSKSLVNKSKQSVFCSVRTAYTVFHTSGQSLPVPIKSLGHGVDPQDKSAGKATTYAQKNALINSFCVAVGKMDDTDTTHSDDIKIPPVDSRSEIEDAQVQEVIDWAIRKGATIKNVETHYKLTPTQKALISKGIKNSK